MTRTRRSPPTRRATGAAGRPGSTGATCCSSWTRGRETVGSSRSPTSMPSIRRCSRWPEADPRWEKIYDLLDPGESGLAEFARGLAGLEVPAPASEEVGFELGEQAWQAELAWPSVKVAVVLAGDDDEARKRNAAYAAA